MVDQDRVLAKLDALAGYVKEIRGITPSGLEDYLANNEKRRACERLLQLAIESAIDVCALLTAGNRLGIPGEEDDLFDRLLKAQVMSEATITKLRKMKGMRNILVHEYDRVDDQLVFEALGRVEDLEKFSKEVLDQLRDMDSEGSGS